MTRGNQEIAGSVTLPQGVERQAHHVHLPFVGVTTPPAATPNTPQPSLWAERAYQVLTIAAMLWILGSLWLFR